MAPFEIAGLVGHETLIGDVPDARRQLVANQGGRDVVADRHEIGDGSPLAVHVAAQEQDLIVAVLAVEAIALRLHDRDLIVPFDRPRIVLVQGGEIGNGLKDVVAGAAQEQVDGLAVGAAGEDVVAGPPKIQSSVLPPASTSSPAPPMRISRRWAAGEPSLVG